MYFSLYYINTISPDLEKIVSIYKNPTPIFEKFGVLKQIKTSFGKTVSFKNGAYLIIEHTEALHVIDVNSGNRAKKVESQEATALEVNLSACDEIARQLRLRDMGGIIVVDFIDMTRQENKVKVNERMRQAMEADRTKHSILPLSRFGLMQITRQRVRPEMHINTREKCPTCGGTGEISPSILITERIELKLKDIRKEEEFNKMILRVHPFVAAYLKKGWMLSIIKKLARKYKCKIRLEGISSYDFLEYRFFDSRGNELTNLK